MIDEIWAPVPEWPGYEASTHGRVRSLGRLARVLKPVVVHGYAYVSLCRGMFVRRFAVHRLVWAAHRAPIPSNIDINHLNGQKTDNRLDNLETCTRAENMAHAKRLGLLGRGETHYNARLTEDDVRAIRAAFSSGRSQREIAQQYGMRQQNVSDICRRRSWSHVLD